MEIIELNELIFFNNFNLNLKEGSCRGRVKIMNLPNLCDRYRIPPQLIQSIFKQAQQNKVI